MESDISSTSSKKPMNAWIVLGFSLLAAVLAWTLWAKFGIARVHQRIAIEVTTRVAQEQSANALDREKAETLRNQRFAELGQSGDAFGSLNTLLTAIAGALVFWAGVMQHRSLRHAQDEAVEERKARQKQSEDMLTTIKISERSAQSAELANQLAREAYVAEQRAWVKVDVSPAGPLTFRDGSVLVTMNILMTNIGKTPALRAFPTFELTALQVGDGDGFGQHRFQKAVEDIRSNPPSDMGFTLFPGESLHLQMTASAPASPARPRFEADSLLILRLLCIASYRLVQEKEGPVHQTGSIYEVIRLDTGRPETKARNRSPTAIWADEGDVPQNELRLLTPPAPSMVAD